MRLADLAGARVALLGFGREGRATAEALPSTSLVVLDDAPRPDGVTLPWLSGAAAIEALRDVDVLVASPGIPPRHPVQAALRERGLRVTTATNLFLAECAEEDVPVVIVTGSKGKSTTSTLLHASLEEAGRAAALAGNVGVPALSALPRILAEHATVVLETSSYQAATLDRSTELVLVTELFPEHLDWHGSFEQYATDKLRACALQEPDALTVWNGASDELRRRAPLGPARHEAYAVEGGVHFAGGWFSRGAQRLFTDDGMLLRGAHNRRNACGVIAAAEALGVEPEQVRAALARVGGLPHRLEDLGLHGGLRWINDSISTAPEAALAALDAYRDDARALIAGGQDRGYDFGALARSIASGPLRCVAVLPPSGLELARELRAAGFAGELRECDDLADAVAWTARAAPAGSTILFSPASPSYGSFRNFEERGARFRELVENLGG
jgi:UDP-N-acetylmuramoylalanine--D-glutamate ligase